MNKNLKKIIIILSGCVSIGIIIVFSTISWNSFLQADDFSHSVAVGVFDENIVGLFIAAVKYSKHMYMTWQGTYFAMFLQAFLSPLNGFGIVELKIVMVLNFILFCGTLFAGVYSFVYKISQDNRYCIPVYAAVVTIIFVFQAWTEVFYWFSGAVSYTIPLSIGMIAIAGSVSEHSKIKYIIEIICVLCAVGGSLEVAGLICFWLLMILLLALFNKMEIKGKLGLFIFAVLGALINVIAPGNYVRHDEIDNSGLHIGRCILYTVDIVKDSVKWLFLNTPVIIIVLMMVCLGASVGLKRNINNVWKAVTMIILSMASPFITAFPVCLAYSYGTYFPNRCEFVLIFSIIVSVGVIGLETGLILSRVLKKKYYLEYISIVLGVLSLLYIGKIGRLNDNTFVRGVYGIINGSYKTYSKKANDVYDKIGMSKQDDVIIDSIPKPVSDFPEITIYDDENNWVNEAIAEYYGKKSVKFRPK